MCYKQKTRYDIMRLAAYRQYNRAILDSADCCKTGRLKRGYGVENILKMLSGNHRYYETHNAVLDAEDELQIMQLLGHELNEYEIALLSDKNISMPGQQQSNVKPSRVIEQQRDVKPSRVIGQQRDVKPSSNTTNQSKRKRGILSWLLGDRRD